MADSTIAQLPSALALTASDYFPVDQGGVTKKATLSLLGNGSVFVTSGKSLYVTNTLTFIGTDGTSITFPTTDATIARTDAGQTFTGTQVFGALTCTTINGGTLAFVAAKTLTVNNTITFTGTDGTTITLPATNATMARTDAAQTFTGTQTFAAILCTSLTVNGGILSIANGKTLTVNNTITFSGTDGTTITLPTTSATMARTDAAQTFTGAQTFSSPVTVGDATAADHAAKLEQISLYPQVTSAAAPDIFAAAGATIDYDNSTPVTMTSIAACTSAQIGSIKRLIPNADTTVTASANLIVDGATSGNFTLPLNGIHEVLPLTTSQFKITTIEASGTWTPTATFSGGDGDLSHSIQVGVWTKHGNIYSYAMQITFAETTASGNLSITGLHAPAKNLTNLNQVNFFAVNGMTGTTGACFGIVGSAGSVINVYQDNGGTLSTITNANTGAATYVYGNFDVHV